HPVPRSCPAPGLQQVVGDPPPGRGGQSRTVPRTQVTVPPATQICPSSCVMVTRPRLPRAVPCDATYGAVNRPDSSSQLASDALRLPVTGSSTATPFAGKNARTSIAAGAPSG